MGAIVGFNKKYDSTTLRLNRKGKDIDLVYDGSDLLMYVEGVFDKSITNGIYGPYSSIESALTATSKKRVLGLTVGILEGNSVVEYWFKSGIEDGDLEIKFGGSEVVEVSDLDVYNSSNEYPFGEIISYQNLLSPDTYYHVLRGYVANKDVPVEISPEDSLYDENTNTNGYWKSIDEEITIPVYQTSLVVRGSYVQIKNIISPRHDDSVIDGNTGFSYVYNAYSTTAESIPYTLRPNNVLSSSPGRWILTYKFIVDKKFQYVIPDIPQGGGITNVELELYSGYSTRPYYYIEDNYEEITDITLVINNDHIQSDAPTAKFSNKEFLIIDSNGAINDLNINVQNNSQYQVRWVNSVQPTTLALGDIAYIEYTRLRDAVAGIYVLLIEWKLLDKQISGGSVLSDDELAAIQNSNNPSAVNTFATIAELENASLSLDTGRTFNSSTINIIAKKETEFNTYTQTGILNINTSNITNTFGDLATVLLPIETNGDDINVFGGVGLYLNSNDYSNDSALYHLFILYANGNPYWALKKVTNTEVVYPLILNYNGDNLNDYITLNFSELCYGNNSASSPILASDLALTVIGLGNTSGITIGSIADINGDVLIGGASALRVNLSITGTPDGTEQISISPVSDSVFNANGIAMQTDQTTGVIGLNNDTIPQLNAPVLTGLVVDGVSQVTATWTDTNTSPNESSLTLQADTSALFDSVDLVEVTGIAANDLTEAVTGLSENTDYYFRVRAIGNGITATSSIWSNILNATTAASNLPFLMTIETTTNNYTVSVLLHQGFAGYYDGTINFGDGSGDKVIGAYNDPNLTHTYTTAGTYQISLSGKLSGLNNGTANTYKTLIKSVDQWGTVEWATLLSMFYGCSGLTTIPTGSFTAKNAQNITNATWMFRGCTACTNIMQTGFLDNLTGLTNVSGMYYDALRSKSIPNNFFVNNKLITNYNQAFYFARNCVLPATLFDLSAISIVTTFASFMNALLVGYSNSGTVQDVWNYATSATSTDAFNNQTALSNYASIPGTWT